MEIPELFPDLTLKENNNRTGVLDYFYDCDGRGDKEHPYHSCYTGLYQKYLYLVGQATVGLWVRDWDWVKDLAYGVMFGEQEEQGDATD